MNNSIRIFRELKALKDGPIGSKYRPDDIVAIGLRYDDKTIEKIECFYKEITELIFQVVDGKHIVCKETKNKVLLGLFILDASGQRIYDSIQYKISQRKRSLKLDGDRRLLAFRGLNQEQREQVVEMTVGQITDFTDSFSEQSEQEDNGWGGNLPWENK